MQIQQMDVQTVTAESVIPTLSLQLPMKMLLGLEYVLKQEKLIFLLSKNS